MYDMRCMIYDVWKSYIIHHKSYILHG